MQISVFFTPSEKIRARLICAMPDLLGKASVAYAAGLQAQQKRVEQSQPPKITALATDSEDVDGNRQLKMFSQVTGVSHAYNNKTVIIELSKTLV